jgi:hypothetical protein
MPGAMYSGFIPVRQSFSTTMADIMRHAASNGGERTPTPLTCPLLRVLASSNVLHTVASTRGNPIYAVCVKRLKPSEAR